MAARRRPRVVIAGAGIAGSLIASGLSDRDDVEVICLERTPSGEQMDAGTGLNVGPNAIKALRRSQPERAATIVANSIPWERWTIELTDGERLMDLPLAQVADNPGIRIRWAELYALLRAPIAAVTRYGAELAACSADDGRIAASVRDVASGEVTSIGDIDLLIAADGRYSVARQTFLGVETPQFLGVCLYRLLFPVEDDCPIDDYTQWFNGPRRLLAFRVPGNFVYLAGSFPILDGMVPPEMKDGARLRQIYVPASGKVSAPVDYLLDKIEAHADRIHWARLQDGSVQYTGPAGVLFVGDAAHPMVPTLGQGATQAVEDACVVADTIRAMLDRGRDLRDVPRAVDMQRGERARFVVDFSREATDTMLEGADPVAGTRRKTSPDFLGRLERLYRQVAEPIA
jgi:salicylate hydroxylase